MKKDKIPVWHLIPNQFEWDIYLCLSDQSYTDIIPILNEHYNLGFDNEDIAQLDDNSNMSLFNIEHRLAIIVLREYNQKTSDYSTLAHEIYHVASMIAQELNIPMDFDHTTEVWAYFISFYMEICLQVLNEHLTKKS